MSRVDAAGRIALFRQKYQEGAPSDCWLWTASVNSGGYGTFWAGSRAECAHRFSYELHVGPIPPGLSLDHLCRVRLCVNPAHLEPVTPQVNNLRGTGFAATRSKQTHCKRGHVFDAQNTYIKTDGCRNCLTCKNTRKDRVA